MCYLLHGDGQLAALVQQLADGVGGVTVTLGQFGHISLDPSDHALHLHLMHLRTTSQSLVSCVCLPVGVNGPALTCVHRSSCNLSNNRNRMSAVSSFC